MALKTWQNADEVIYGNDLNANFAALAAGTEITAGVITPPKLSTDLADGWITGCAGTYASAASITITTWPGSGTPQVGDKIRFKQGGAYKYFYVQAYAAPTLYIVANQDYTLTNAAITDFAYSKATNPTGFPGAFRLDPTWNSTGTQPSVGNGSILGKYTMNGRWVTYNFRLNWNTTTNPGTGGWSFSTPTYAATLSGWAQYGVAWAFTGSRYAGVAEISSGVNTLAISYDGSANAAQSGIPFTWANGYQLGVNITYEASSNYSS